MSRIAMTDRWNCWLSLHVISTRTNPNLHSFVLVKAKERNVLIVFSSLFIHTVCPMHVCVVCVQKATCWLKKEEKNQKSSTWTWCKAHRKRMKWKCTHQRCCELYFFFGWCFLIHLIWVILRNVLKRWWFSCLLTTNTRTRFQAVCEDIRQKWNYFKISFG